MCVSKVQEGSQLCSLYQALTLGVCMSAALCLTQDERVISKTVVPPALTQ